MNRHIELITSTHEVRFNGIAIMLKIKSVLARYLTLAHSGFCNFAKRQISHGQACLDAL
jgi:hypothetical protein